MPKLTQSIVIDTADSTEPYFATSAIISLDQPMNITCLATTIMDVIPSRQLKNQWTYSTSFNINEYEIEDTSNLSTTLMIDQVSFYNRGVYHCSSSISICGKHQTLNGQFQLILKGNLHVQVYIIIMIKHLFLLVKNPRISLTADYPKPFYEGTYFSLSCLLQELDYPVDFNWTFSYERGNIAIPNRYTYSRVHEHLTKHSLTNSSKTLTFTALNYYIDSGQYYCSIRGTSDEYLQKVFVDSTFNLTVTSM